MNADTGRTASGHDDPGELLNAYLDGELDVDERALVDRALVDSGELRGELDELRATQSLLRALPLVDPVAEPQPTTAPTASLGTDRAASTADDSAAAATVMSLDRRRRRTVATAVGAVAAALLVLVGVGATLDPMPVAPAVDELASAHMGTSGGFNDMDVDAMDDPAVLDTLGDDMERMAVYARDDLVRTVYSDGAHEMSVFHEPGVVDWDALPDDGSMIVDGPTKTWTGVRDETVVAVAERGDLVVVIVADADMGADEAMAKATEAVTMVPPVQVERDLWQRVSDAPGNIVDRI